MYSVGRSIYRNLKINNNLISDPFIISTMPPPTMWLNNSIVVLFCFWTGEFSRPAVQPQSQCLFSEWKTWRQSTAATTCKLLEIRINLGITWNINIIDLWRIDSNILYVYNYKGTESNVYKRIQIKGYKLPSI